MVLGVCRRLLGHEQDAEDAFQATFLVLARKAGSLAWHESVAGWLFEVARRVAQGARRAGLRRRSEERQAAAMHPPHSPAGDARTAPEEHAHLRDVRLVLDEELDRLPEKYRTPLVLCYLEGHSHTEAADELGWPVGTVRGRLARGRDLLRRRLVRRGLALPVLAVAAALTQQVASAAVPPALASSTVRVALRLAAGTAVAEAGSPHVAVLVEQALRVSAAARLTLYTALLAAGVFAALTGLVAYRVGIERLTELPRTAVISPLGPEPATSPPVVPAPRGDTRDRQAGAVVDLAFSPDGKTLATAGGESCVRLWDRTTRRPLGCLTGQADLVHALAFSPDGRLLAAAAADGTVCVWDLPGGRLLGLRRDFGAGRLAGFAGNGKLLAVAGPTSGLRLWDFTAGKDVATLTGPLGTLVRELAVAPDGRVVASAPDGFDPVISLWDLGTGEKGAGREVTEFRRLVPNRGKVVSLALTAGGTLLAVASRKMDTRPNEVSLWDVETGRMRHLLPGPHGDLVRFSADGRFLVTSGRGEPAVVWDLRTADAPRRLWQSSVPAEAAAFAHDGALVGWSAEGRIHLFDAAGRERNVIETEPVAALHSAGEYDPLWGDLAAAGPAGEQAMRRLSVSPDGAVPFLRSRLEKDRSLADRIDWLIARLADDELSRGQAAAAELGRLRSAAEPALRQALGGAPAPEVRRRIEALLRLPSPQVREPLPEERRLIRAVIVLARLGSPEAKAVLHTLDANPALRAALAETDFDAALVAEARSALADR
jgi:RNA polymerase sigma factor (sigma-70 family)